MKFYVHVFIYVKEGGGGNFALMHCIYMVTHIVSLYYITA